MAELAEKQLAVRIPPLDRFLRNQVLFTVLGSASVVVGFAWYFAVSAALAAPVRIHVEGFSSSALQPGKETVRLFAVSERDEPPYPVLPRLWQTDYWFMEGIWVQRLLVLLPPEELPRITSFTVTVGDDVPIQATGDEVRSWRRTATRETILIVPLVSRWSALPWASARHVNWPGDAVYWRTVAQYSLAPVVLILFVSFWRGMMRTQTSEVLKTSEVSWQGDGKISARFWNVTGLLFLAGCLLFLELRDAYYFCQNDTIMECFPMILTGMRSFWKGEFPDYNPYLFLGCPLASLGMYSLTYPPMHLSYALARHVLGDEYATIEVFAVLHIVAGFLGTRMLARRTGMSAMPANLVALSFVLSGASLIMGRSWFNFIPLVLWLPLAFLGLVRLREGPVTWKWTLAMGVVLGMPIHVGFAQIALYLIGFFCLGVLCLALAGALPRPNAAAALSALCLAAGIGAPLAYQQWLIAQDSTQSPVQADGVAMGLAAMLLPFPLVQARLPVHFGNVNLPWLSQFYFFGGLLAWLFLFQLAGILCRRPGRKEWPQHIWSIGAIAALWLSLGQSLGLWTLVEKLPVLGFLNRHPLRVMPFVVFFVSMAGGLTLEKLLRLSRRRAKTEVVLGTLALALLGWHVSLCRTAFYVEGFSPYPALPAEFAERFWKDGQVTGRVVCWSRHSRAAVDGRVLPGNLPAVYGLPQTGGLSPLLAKSDFASGPSRRARDSLPAHRAYGNRWHLLPAPNQPVPIGSAYSWWYGQAGNLPERLAKLAGYLKPINAPDGTGGVMLYELEHTDPLAFPCAAPVAAAAESAVERHALPVTFHGDGVDVNVADVGQGQWITVNFHCYSGAVMRVTLDGRELQRHSDFWERIAVQLPAQGSVLSVRYAPNWTQGMFLSLAAWIGAGLMAWASLKCR